jgi:DNA polymerase-3 subunit epsilon
VTTTDQPRLEHEARCASWDSNDPATCDCRDDAGHTPPACWADGRLLAFDTETTGKDPLTARLVTATVIDIRPRRQPIVTSWLSDVGGEAIPDEAAEIHGVTTEYAHANGKPIADVVNQIAGALQFAFENNVPVVGHNVVYDLTIIAAESERLGLPTFEVAGPVVDTIVLDRGTDRFRRGKRTLTATCEHYGIELTAEDAHSADADALAAARLAWKIAKKYEVVGNMPLRALQEWQRKAHRQWADGFGAYLIKQGKDDDVSRDWPLRGAS